jgi:hypothetical protein
MKQLPFFKFYLFFSLLVAMAVFSLAVRGAAQTTSKPDPRIVAALRQISSQRIQSNIEKLVHFHTRSTISAQDTQSIASGQGIGAAREWIKSEFERYSQECGGCLEVKTDSFTLGPAERIPGPTVITNVYAILKGTDSSNANRVVLVTGHYDSRATDVLDTSGFAPGANDDGSGTAVSLECARVLSKMKFPATIIFLTVAGEEQGLDGSHHFAELAKTSGWRVEAALNNDIVGGDRNPRQNPRVVRVFSEGVPLTADPAALRMMQNIGGENDSPSRELARYVAETAQTYATEVTPMLVFRLDRYLRGGDHISFLEQSFPAVRFTEYSENFNHQHQNVRTDHGVEYGDLPKFVNFDYVANVARVNAATLASLAAGPAPPQNVRLLVNSLENGSTLTWDPPSSADQPHYEVVWRLTTSPEWEHHKNVGNETRVTLPLSKDDVIFGVLASDGKGHRSLPVIPEPER